jgi:DNA transformation protein and related proteins
MNRFWIISIVVGLVWCMDVTAGEPKVPQPVFKKLWWQPMTNDAPIESLLNLGPKSGQWLRDAGITTIAELGTPRPSCRIATREATPAQEPASTCLWALAAGLKGQDWRELTEATKRRLRKEAEEQ